jgi:small subunit ribosomal protein S20
LCDTSSILQRDLQAANYKGRYTFWQLAQDAEQQIASIYPSPFDLCARMGYNRPAFWQGNERGRTTLANTHSAIKRIRSNERKRQVNLLHRTRARTYVKRTRRLIITGKLGEAEAMANQAASAVDKAAQKGVIHKNTAARRKSRLMRRLNQARQQKAA